MLRYRQMKSFQKFASVDANVHNHFNLERHLTDRETYKTAARPHWPSGRALLPDIGFRQASCAQRRRVRIRLTAPERAMLRFRQMKSLQKLASVHASITNHFSQERHLVDRETYKQRRSAALAEWQMLAA